MVSYNAQPIMGFDRYAIYKMPERIQSVNNALRLDECPSFEKVHYGADDSAYNDQRSLSTSLGPDSFDTHCCGAQLVDGCVNCHLRNNFPDPAAARSGEDDWLGTAHSAEMAYCVQLPNGGEHEFYATPALLADMATGHTHGPSEAAPFDEASLIRAYYDPVGSSAPGNSYTHGHTGATAAAVANGGYVTGIPGSGRSQRPALSPVSSTVSDLAGADREEAPNDRFSPGGARSGLGVRRSQTADLSRWNLVFARDAETVLSRSTTSEGVEGDYCGIDFSDIEA